MPDTQLLPDQNVVPDIRKNEQIVFDTKQAFMTQDEILNEVIDKLRGEIQNLSIVGSKPSETLANVAVVSQLNDFIKTVDSHVITVSKMELGINKETEAGDSDMVSAIVAHLLSKTKINEMPNAPADSPSLPDPADLDREFNDRNLSVTDAEVKEVTKEIEGLDGAAVDSTDEPEESI